jgi:hypothetical protein
VLDQDKQGGITGVEVCGQLFHEGVVDAEIGQRAAERAGRSADRNPEDRVQKQHADQKSPKTSGHGPHGCRVDELIELDVAGIGFDGDHGIADGDEILLLHFEKPLAYLLGFRLGRVHDRHEIGHRNLLSFVGWMGGC